MDSNGPRNSQEPEEPDSQRLTFLAQSRNNNTKTAFAKWLHKILPPFKNGSKNGEDTFREAIEELIEEEHNTPQSAVSTHERHLISNILQLRDLPVVDIMVPRADIVAIDIHSTLDELYALLASHPHSRLPVYKDDLDSVMGVLHMKDVVASIAAKADFELRDIIRDALVVSPSMRVMDLLLQMRQSKMHIAFVVDEFGGIDGLITINDLIEAIVGEIDDEFGFELEPQMIERADGSAVADARYTIEDFEKRYGAVFADDEDREEVDTLGGFVTNIAGHVPTRGEIVKHDNTKIEFEILDADPRRITRMRIRNLPRKEDQTA